MQPEAWTLLRKTANECIVARDVGGKATIWNLQLRDKGWRIYAIRFSKLNPGANLTAERTKVYLGNCKSGKGMCNGTNYHKNGIPLSDNRLDRILRDYCDGVRK